MLKMRIDFLTVTIVTLILTINGHQNHRTFNAFEKIILKAMSNNLTQSDLTLLKNLNLTEKDLIYLKKRGSSRHSKEPTEYTTPINFNPNNDRLNYSESLRAFNEKALMDYENLASNETTGYDYERDVQTESNENNDYKDDIGNAGETLFRDSSTIDDYPDTPDIYGLSDRRRVVDHRSRRDRLQENSMIVEKGEEIVNGYEGLELIEDDVYRVLPEVGEDPKFEEGNETEYKIDREDKELAQRDGPEVIQVMIARSNESNKWIDMTLDKHFATIQEKLQEQIAVENYKMRVLAMTGRYNHTNVTQIQPKKLTRFEPTCEIPSNTDAEAWSDPFSMNMLFQLNLTSNDHVMDARLRIYQLPYKNSTDRIDDDQKSIKVSVYYYTESLQKHKSRKRLMDSVSAPLTSKGNHHALNVIKGLQFWSQHSKNSQSTSNHGLVVQVEDENGRSLRPSHYIQQSPCSDHNEDEKAYQRVPALFFRTCIRYSRIVNGATETYVNCKYQ